MRIAKYATGPGHRPQLGLVEGDRIKPLARETGDLCDLLHAEDLTARLAGPFEAEVPSTRSACSRRSMSGSLGRRGYL